MGITIFKFFIWEVFRRIYVRKSRFTAQLACCLKTKFPIVYPTIYLPKRNFEYSYPLNDLDFAISFLFVLMFVGKDKLTKICLKL